MDESSVYKNDYHTSGDNQGKMRLYILITNSILTSFEHSRRVGDDEGVSSYLHVAKLHKLTAGAE